MIHASTMHSLKTQRSLFVFTMFFSFFYWALCSGSVSQVLAIFGIYYKQATNVMQYCTLMLLVVWWISLKRVRVKPIAGAFTIGLLIVCILSVRNQPNYMGFFSSLSSLINRYFSFFVFLLCLFVNPTNKIKYGTRAVSLCLGFSLVQAIIGILQFVFKSVIFPTQINGISLVVSPYYVTGDNPGGTGSLDGVGTQYLVRATGLTGAGLYLGIVLLVSLALTCIIKNRSLRVMCQFVFLVAIILTITITVWIGLASMMTLYFVLRKKAISNSALGIILGVNVVWPWLGEFLAGISQSFGTLNSRFRGITYYLTNMNRGISSLLFGQNFITFWTLKSTNEHFTLTMDNTLYAWLLNVGIVGIVICCYCIFVAYMKIQYISDSKVRIIFQALLISLLLIANANDFTRYLGLPLLLFLLYSLEKPAKSDETFNI